MLLSIIYIILAMISILFFFTFIKPLSKLLLLKLKHGSDILVKFSPILGIQPYYKRNERMYGDPFYELKKEILKNPKLKAIAWNLGFGVCVTSIDPDLTKSFLVENYQKSVKLAPIFNYRSLKNGIVFSEGEAWKKQRRMIADSFHFDSLKSRFGVITQVTKEKIKDLSKYVGQENFPLFDEMMKHSGEIGIRVFFGPDFGEHQINGKSISEELTQVVDQTIIYSYTSIFFQLKRVILGEELAMKILTQKEKSILSRTERIQQIAMKQIEKKIKQSEENPNIQSDYLIDILVKNYIQKSDPSLTIQQICEQCTTMFIAALDNTGCFIAWAIFCLANYQQEGDLVRKEIDSIFSTTEKLENIQFDDLRNLVYTSAFIDECFRHYSSSMGVFIRKVTEPFKAGSFQLSQGDYIQCHWFGGFNNPDWFENPDKFDVSRFLNGKEKTINPYAFTPFSVGPRNCIGKQMSLIEIKVALIYFVKYFNASRNESVPLKTTTSLVYKPSNQNLIKITNRS